MKVAREACVAASTASLALRGSPRVLPETVERVKAAAKRLGYSADPRVGSLMARIRMAKEIHDRERIAFVWVNGLKEDRLRDRFSQTTVACAKRRAEELGWAMEEFWLGSDGMTPARLEKVLLTRGITGVVFSSPLAVHSTTVDWNWSHFASALIGNLEFHPPLHRAGHHHYQNMWTAVEKLRAAGCARPAAVLFEPHQLHMQGIHQAAFLANYPLPRQALSMVRFGLPESRAETLAWLEKVKADGLVFGMNPSEETLHWLRTLPRIKCMVTVDRPEPGLPGINTQNGAIAADAVDLVIAQLHRNERGVPVSPISVLPEGVWEDFG
ncbi:LacI family DNA-binding transcriptional regulator [Rariglobus hedericola]|nr:LacI family DNA-binding transcriptional regulator [Rariglobus hedericola]